MRVLVGADHAGFRAKEDLKPVLAAFGADVVDLGANSDAPCDYPEIAARVARGVAAGEAPRGVLVCGSGQGMAIAANRVPGVRAALCPDVEWARLARAHNDANVLVLAARMTPPGRIAEIVRAFFETPFEGGRHARRVAAIDAEAGARA